MRLRDIEWLIADIVTALIVMVVSISGLVYALNSLATCKTHTLPPTPSVKSNYDIPIPLPR